MIEIVESARYYTLINDYIPIIFIVVLILNILFIFYSLYGLFKYKNLPDKHAKNINNLTIGSFPLFILLFILLFNMPKLLLFEYYNNILNEEYGKDLENHFAFIKENNNIDEEKSSYFFNKNKETNEYELIYQIYMNNNETFIHKDSNLDGTLKEVLTYNINRKYSEKYKE